LAAWTQAGDFCLKHPGEQWIINQKINTNILEWWKNNQPQAKLIAMGTSCVYDCELPLSEEFYLKGTPIESLFSYGMTKKMLYAGLIALNKQYGLNYLYVIPSTLYGPGYHTDGRQKHFIFDLISKIIKGKTTGVPVKLWGNGYQKRELVLADDFADILFELDKKSKNDIFNIGAGKEYSIRYFAETICKKIDYDPALIEYDLTKHVGAKSKCLLTKKLNNTIRYKMTSFDKGLESSLKQFQ